MKSTSQLLATILISLALVNAAPLPSPQFSGLIDAVGPLEQKYCAPGKNFKDPICPEYAGVKGAMAKQRRTFDPSNPSSVVPDTSSFPNPAGPLFGEVGSVGSLLSGSGPSKDSPFPTLTGESASVLDGTSGPAGKPAARRQLNPAAAGGLLTTAESLLGGNANVAVKREPTSPSLNDLSGLSALGPALGGKAAVPSNGAFNFGTLPKREEVAALEKRQLEGVGVPVVGPLLTGLTGSAPAQKRQGSLLEGLPLVGPLLPGSGSPPAQKRQLGGVPVVGSLVGGSAPAQRRQAELAGVPIVGSLLAGAAPAQKRQGSPLQEVPVIGGLLGGKPAAAAKRQLEGIPVVGGLIAPLSSGLGGSAPASPAA